MNRKSQNKTGFGRTIINDLHENLNQNYLFRDFREINEQFLNSEERRKILGMGRFNRWFVRCWWLLKSMFFKLTSLQRILFVCAVILSLTDIGFGNNPEIGFLLLLLVLMIELKNKLLMRSEFQAGRAVQQALLPHKNPAIPGWDVCLYTRPANEVGGDLVDYHTLDKRRWGLVLGDVSGKGLGAALYMARLQAVLRAFAPESNSIVDLLGKTNRFFCQDGLPEKFASLIYIELDTNACELSLSNAGHLPPLLIQDGQLHEIDSKSPALGIIPNATYHRRKLDLEPGNTLVLYSDGVTEAFNTGQELFGEERLQRLLPKISSATAADIADKIISAVDGFSQQTQPSDDLSLLIIKRTKTCD
ncbi:serine/threonine-protein phosphatase [bacterium]|nr:serine/threonine-protein phosphatase [bacterium]